MAVVPNKYILNLANQVTKKEVVYNFFLIDPIEENKKELLKEENELF